MSGASRIHNPQLRSKIMSAEEAAKLVKNGDNVGVSGFTGSGYPKVLPDAIAAHGQKLHAKGEEFRIGLWTGASTAPELDGSLAKANVVSMRLPYQSDADCRNAINDDKMQYTDIHLSQVAQFASFGHLGKLNVAIVEATAIREDGSLIPSTSLGNNNTWLDLADKVIIEVNSWQKMELEGLHDIYYGMELPPNRKPIPLLKPADRIGEKYMRCDPKKILAVVETDSGDRNSAFSAPDADSQKIAQHILEFFSHEVKKGRLPKNLLPLQSGVGNIANAVMEGLNEGPFTNLTAYTEVLQDGMLKMIKSGKLECASATAFSLSPNGLTELNDNFENYRERIILRNQDVSNHPEVIRRLGVLSMNGMIEADIYGNVNSTHIMGTKLMNGIGGSGDFARSAYFSFFMTPSAAKGGAISCIVPMVSHIDHTEHDVQFIVTEQGLADLRGLSPKQRAQVIINNCAHPNFKDVLKDYYKRAFASCVGKHTPHILEEAFNFHQKFLKTGNML